MYVSDCILELQQQKLAARMVMCMSWSAPCCVQASCACAPSSMLVSWTGGYACSQGKSGLNTRQQTGLVSYPQWCVHGDPRNAGTIAQEDCETLLQPATHLCPVGVGGAEGLGLGAGGGQFKGTLTSLTNCSS